MSLKNIRFISNCVFAKGALLGLSLLILSGCRLVITSDETGQILSASGSHDCNQASCTATITEEFNETFTAVAADGYRFIGWGGVCARAPTEVCDLILVPLAPKFNEYDGDVDLSALFESTSVRRAWYLDEDGDDYGTPTNTKMAFERPEGFALYKTDCDDTDESVHPWVKEREDGRDTNCNGRVDEGFVDVAFYIDRDGDGFGNARVIRMARRRPAGYVRNDLDCNDTSAEDNPAATEIIDNRDNNCDGIIDEGSENYYRDVDGDGFGIPGGAIESLEPVYGENIAAGTSLSSVGAVVQAWIDSPGHCANMMGRNFTNLGAAKFSNVSSTYTLYWTQMFGRPR